MQNGIKITKICLYTNSHNIYVAVLILLSSRQFLQHAATEGHTDTVENVAKKADVTVKSKDGAMLISVLIPRVFCLHS